MKCFKKILLLFLLLALSCTHVCHAQECCDSSSVHTRQKSHNLTLKTNLIGWAMLGANISIEYDVCQHISVALPVHYCGFDYFKETVKFRGLSIQPEVRYYPWLDENMKNNGFFVGAHLGAGLYNFALGGDYRVQDHKGKRPAYGGGIGLGYELKFKKNPRWGMEFSIGGGVYDVCYDIFYNENNGPYYEKKVRDIWFGVDNASISFTYMFDLVKKGGKK